MDFYDTFATDPGFTEAAPTFGVNCGNMLHYTSNLYEMSIYCLQWNDGNEKRLFTSGTLNGEFWVTYSDHEQDTNGKVRLQPKQLADLKDDSFIYATFSVDSVTTHRRYPQIVVSDQTYP